MFIMEYHLSCQTYPIFSLLLFKKGGSAAMTRKASLPGSPESLRPVHSSGVPTCFGFKVGSEWKLLRDMNGLLMDYSGMVFDGFLDPEADTITGCHTLNGSRFMLH